MTQPDGTDSSTETRAPEDHAERPDPRTPQTDWMSVLQNAAPWVNRVGALVAAGLMLFAAKAWWDRARDLSDPCGTTKLSRAVCDEVPEFLQSLQFALAIAGITVAVLLAGLMVFQAVSGRSVRRLRLVATTLAVLGLAWVVLFLVGWLLF